MASLWQWRRRRGLSPPLGGSGRRGFSSGGSPEDFAPLFPFFLSTCLWWERGSLPSLVLVRVIREEPAPLFGRDVYLRFTLFQVHGLWISYPGAVTNAATTCVQIAKLCVGYSRRSTESDPFIGITEDGRLRRIGVGHHWHGGRACPPSHRRISTMGCSRFYGRLLKRFLGYLMTPRT